MKILKIILWNIILTLVLLFVADFTAYMIFSKHQPMKPDLPSRLKYYTKIIPNRTLEKNYILSKELKKIENKESDKKPILIFGCSYANGVGIKKDETFPARLGQITKRPIYNRTVNGMGPQFTYYQVSRDKFYKIIPKPEYVIYVYIQSHIPRMYIGGSGYVNRYIFYKENTLNSEKKLKRDYLREIFFRSYLFYVFSMKQKDKIKSKPKLNNLSLLKTYFIEIKKEMEERWGKDIKFVILLYEKKEYINAIRPILPELRANGIEIIDINELSSINFKSKKYYLKDKDTHPNAAAWDTITPLIVNKLGL